MNNLIYSIPGGLAIWTLVLMSNFAFAQIDFRTDLAGEHEVPPIFSESYGSALVGGNDDNLKYQINVTSLDKVTGVFLHKGDSTENGQILVSLLNSTEPSGVIDGNLIEGTINSSSILLPLANLTTNILAVPASANLTNATAATVGNLTNATAATVGNLTNATAATVGNFTNATASANPPSKLEALIDLMGQNMTYINILTSDFPQGELRGTLTSTNSTG
ncbi:MAG TPA: CHRD domain-containing protein [Nitrososphaeraceae archaeon]|nr:CHRD domain-containing protein [Nitrososphaeraceae archaeon]